MTEAQWRASNDLFGMLDYVLVRASERKLRLFACACVRELGHLLADARVRRAFFVAERFADDLAGPAELSAAHADAEAALRRLLNAVSAHEQFGPQVFPRVAAVHGALRLVTSPCLPATEVAHAATAALLLRHAGDPAWTARALGTVCDQLREVFGNPFRRVKLDRAWLRGAGAPTALVARAIYHDRSFDELPALADALEDADCPSPDLIAHCRAAAPHGRGCWAVDALLAKR
jgi:hypothetical protein